MARNLGCGLLLALFLTLVVLDPTWSQFNTIRQTANLARNVTSALTFGVLDSRNYRLRKNAVVDSIRQTGKKWVADLNPEFEEMGVSDFRTLLGGVVLDPAARVFKAIPIGRRTPPKYGPQGRGKREELPASYDVRVNYPMCKSIDSPRNQYTCSSCWAVTAASVMSDRHCIFNAERTGQLYFSPYHIVACVPNGCQGGKEWDAYDYWVDEGLVTGGAGYPAANQPDGCLPYPVGFNETPTECPTLCAISHTKQFEEEKVQGGKWYNWWNPTVKEIQQEIFTFGPVAAFFTVYEDLFYYKDGVYENTYGNVVGHHLAKLIGWGTEQGIDYWLAVNTWGSGWGKNGVFKIRRGNNTVGIEARVSTALPKEGFTEDE